jgi:hypothetical protein
MEAQLPSWTEISAPDADFEALAARVWAVQRRDNAVIRRFVAALGSTDPTFIPISFFRDFDLRVGEDWEPEAVFRSSGTTATAPDARSRHLVRDLGLYTQAARAGFRHFFPDGDYAVFALLPNYLQAGDSSLVQMVKDFIVDFGTPDSGFYLDNFDALRQALVAASERRERILLIGVTYALLDFAAHHGLHLPPDAIVMETGGMKGRRKELVRAELHAALKAGFHVDRIYSEYGMTELLSQAYTDGGERFFSPPWLRCVVTDLYLPGVVLPHGQAGRINLIDLANLHSCAFIRTDDLGRSHADGSFEVLGRLDHADLRGCNLLVD